jgi:hypothetical protein
MTSEKFAEVILGPACFGDFAVMDIEVEEENGKV